MRKGTIMRKKLITSIVVFGMAAAMVASTVISATSFANVEKDLTMKKVTNYKEHTNQGGQYVDGHTFLSYSWSGSSKNVSCVQGKLKNGKLQKKKIALNKKTKAFLKKYKFQSGSEWRDGKSNFYCVAGKTIKGKYNGYLVRINKKGKITKKIALKKSLKINQSENAYCSFEVEQIVKNTVVCKYKDIKNHGYVLLNKNTGAVKEQLVASADNLYPLAYTSKSIAVYNPWEKSNYITLAAIPKKKTIKVSSGKKIKYARITSSAKKDVIPQEKGQIAQSIATYGDKMYLLTAEGYYKVDATKGTCNKLASTKNIDLLHESYEGVSKEGNVVKIFPVSDSKFVMKTGYKDEEDPESHYNSLWEVTVG